MTRRDTIPACWAQQGRLDQAEVMQRVHGRYAQYFNAPRGRCGQLNPVRAGIVQKAEVYEWSSARAHLAGQDPQRLLDMDFWRREGGISNWLQLLNEWSKGWSAGLRAVPPIRANPLEMKSV